MGAQNGRPGAEGDPPSVSARFNAGQDCVQVGTAGWLWAWQGQVGG